jgi:hypothetical protein
MKEHHKFKINWIGFPKTHRKVKGVYRIENFYVGASIHIRSRILSHCYLCLSKEDFKVNYNQKMYSELKRCYLEKGFINVTYLDGNPLNEGVYILGDTNLLNIDRKSFYKVKI